MCIVSLLSMMQSRRECVGFNDFDLGVYKK
jgi:hypothetical protein